MGENYYHCENCLGTGQIINVIEDPVLLRKENKAVECSRCDGTGMSGNADHLRQAEAERELDSCI